MDIVKSKPDSHMCCFCRIFLMRILFFSSVFFKEKRVGLSLQVDNCRYYDAVYGEEGEEGVMHPREHFYTTFSLGKNGEKIAFLLQQSHLKKKQSVTASLRPRKNCQNIFLPSQLDLLPPKNGHVLGGADVGRGRKRCSIMARQSGGKRRRERMPPEEEEEEEGASSSSLLFQKVTVAGARPKKNDCSFLPFLRPI